MSAPSASLATALSRCDLACWRSVSARSQWRIRAFGCFDPGLTVVCGGPVVLPELVNTRDAGRDEVRNVCQEPVLSRSRRACEMQ
jgi:hypothetical protein